MEMKKEKGVTNLTRSHSADHMEVAGQQLEHLGRSIDHYSTRPDSPIGRCRSRHRRVARRHADCVRHSHWIVELVAIQDRPTG